MKSVRRESRVDSNGFASNVSSPRFPPLSHLTVMKVLNAIFVALLLVAKVGSAQSCPAADSVLSAQQKKVKLRTYYDKMTDTTSVGISYIVSVPMTGDPATVMLQGFFRGKSLNDSAFVRMTAEFKQQGEGGIIMGRSSTGTGPLSSSMAKYADVKDAKFLLDDSVRISLPVESYKAGVKKAGIISAEALVETLTFIIPASERIKIAHTREGKMRIGDYEFDFGRDEIVGLQEFTRWQICNSPTLGVSTSH